MNWWGTQGSPLYQQDLKTQDFLTFPGPCGDGWSWNRVLFPVCEKLANHRLPLAHLSVKGLS